MEITELPILEVALSNEDEESILIENDHHIEEIVKALSSATRRRILSQIQKDPADVSKIASNLNMTEANISAQIKKLEKAGLIECSYSSGQHGVRKISSLKYNQLTIKF
ncbi:MAG: ArsR/SmtB family transcription factor [Promethearchaeota archaeon]